MDAISEVKEIFDRIKESGGDAGYVAKVLSLIWTEEFERKEKPPEMTYVRSPLDLDVKRYDKDRLVEVGDSSNNLPEPLRGKWLLEMHLILIPLEHRLSEILYGDSKIVLSGKKFRPVETNGSKLTIRLEQEAVCDNERYVVTLSQSGIEPPVSSDVKRQRGRKGEHQSNLAMYLLYRYFNCLGLKAVYKSIAVLVNSFSLLFYCDGKGASGASLSPENVRKRIQLVKKKKELCDKALEFEKNWDGKKPASEC